MDFAEGESSTQRYTPGLIRDLARTQATMHVLGMEYAKKMRGNEKIYTEMDNWLANRTEEYAGNNTEISNFLKRARLIRYALNPTLLHGWNHLDLDIVGNVIVKDDKVNAIVDFADLDYSPCVMCLGYSLWAVLFAEDEAAVRMYLAEYIKIRPLTKKEYEALPHIMLFRNYMIGIVEFLVLKKEEKKEIFLRLEKEIPKIKVNE